MVSHAPTDRVIQKTDLTLESSSKFYSSKAVSWRDEIWLVGGYAPNNLEPESGGRSRRVLSSADGCLTWTQHANLPYYTASHGLCVLNDRLFLIGGIQLTAGGYAITDQYNTRSVWYTDDGENWTHQINCMVGRYYDTVHLVHDEKLWSIGGDPSGRIVEWSADGLTWNLVYLGADWLNVFPHNISLAAGISYGGNILIIGGSHDTPGHVWQSPDGANWTSIYTFDGTLQMHSVHRIADTIYILPGYFPELGDEWDQWCWKSIDGGLSWQIFASTPVDMRGHAGVAHDNRLYMIGGGIPLGGTSVYAYTPLWVELDTTTYEREDTRSPTWRDEEDTPERWLDKDGRSIMVQPMSGEWYPETAYFPSGLSFHTEYLVGYIERPAVISDLSEDVIDTRIKEHLQPAIAYYAASLLLEIDNDRKDPERAGQLAEIFEQLVLEHAYWGSYA